MAEDVSGSSKALTKGSQNVDGDDSGAQIAAPGADEEIRLT